MDGSISLILYVISMPDKWEYPWYASWDLTSLPLRRLGACGHRLCQATAGLNDWERYMHPNGQLPAYEWNYYDVNPPVHAWSALRVYQFDAKTELESPDRDFLKGLHK